MSRQMGYSAIGQGNRICEAGYGKNGNVVNAVTKRFQSLEEEIAYLRQTMVSSYSSGGSFTSEMMISLSHQLDEKINQYMKKNKMSS